MVSDLSSADVTTYEYPTDLPFTGSSIKEETVEKEMLNRFPYNIKPKEKHRGYYINNELKPPFEIDASSVFPHFERSSETYFSSDELSEEEIINSILDHNYIQLKPRRDYKIKVKVKSIEKATPRIVKSEGISYGD